jgi:hypothetical protein
VSQMKLVLVPILMLLLLTQTFSKWAVVLEYQLNKNYISQKLCVNKVKPKLNCNGKCQMMKRLKEEERKDQQNQERRTENKNEVISSKSFFAVLVIVGEKAPRASFSRYNTSITRGIHSSVFHPPGLV